MKSLLERIAPKASKKAKKTPMLAFLIHIEPAWEGIRHMLICARTLDEAFANTIESPWAKSRSLGLGFVVYEHTWAQFTNHNFGHSCCYCNKQGLLAACDESREFARRLMEFSRQNKQLELYPVGAVELGKDGE